MTVVLLFALVLALYLVGTKTNLIQRASTPAYTKVNNAVELEEARKSLENTDLNHIDLELDKNDQELSKF